LISGPLWARSGGYLLGAYSSTLLIEKEEEREEKRQNMTGLYENKKGFTKAFLLSKDCQIISTVVKIIARVKICRG
jgi:hypothetical protein